MTPTFYTGLLAASVTLAALPPTSAAAQTPVPVAPQPAPAYTLARLEALMLETSPAVRSIREATRGAQAAVRTARTIPNPELEVMNGNLRKRSNDDSYGNTKSYSLTQPLDLPWTRFPRVDAAQAGFEAAQAQERASLADLRADLRTAFFDVLRRQSELRAAEEDRQLTEGIRKRIALRVDTGEAAKFELVKADAEMLMAQKAAQSALTRTQQARAALRALVGPELPERYDIVPGPQDIAVPQSMQVLRDDILQSNPVLQSLRAQARQSEFRLSEQKALRLPQVSLRADMGTDPDYRSRSTGVQMTVPLWDWRGGPVAEAAARLAQSQNDVQAIEFGLVQRVENAYRQYEIAQAQVGALESGIVRQAENALRIAETAYRAGEKGFLEVLDAQRVYRAARNELITARFELASAWIELERLRAQP